jgi:hypothetical protein
VPNPGRYRIDLELYERSGAISSPTPLPAPTPAEITVTDSAAEQIFDLSLPPAALTLISEKIGA